MAEKLTEFYFINFIAALFKGRKRNLPARFSAFFISRSTAMTAMEKENATEGSSIRLRRNK
jgi:hypothetical protein